MKRIMASVLALSLFVCISAFSEAPIIQKGDSGGTVLAIQKILFSLDYLSEEYVNGEFEDMTELSVLAFQLDHGISPTGIADAETQSAIIGSVKDEHASAPNKNIEETEKNNQAAVAEDESPVNAREGVTAREGKTEEAEKGQKQILIDDDNVTVELVSLKDEPSLGAFFVTLKVTNKTNKKVWVYLDEASVNNEMMLMVFSGVPLYILPNMTGSNAFTFYFQQLSIDSFDEVENIAFKIGVKDEDTFETIEETERVTIVNK